MNIADKTVKTRTQFTPGQLPDFPELPVELTDVPGMTEYAAAIREWNDNLKTALTGASNVAQNRITLAEKTVNGVKTSVTQEAAVRLAADQSVYAMWAIAIDVNGRIVGRIKLDGTAQTSTFEVLAANFRVVTPGQSEFALLDVRAIGIVFGTDLASDNFVTGATGAGWQIKRSGDAEVRNLIAWDTFSAYTISPPSLSPAAQLFTTSIAISIAAQAGETVRYTSDGQQVTSASQEWPKGGGVYTTLTLTGTTTLRLRSFNGTQCSAETTATYTLDSTTARVATPGINGPAGHNGTAYVYCGTSGASISYQKNGGGYGAYTVGIAVSIGDTIEAYATHAGMTDSDTAYYENFDPNL